MCFIDLNQIRDTVSKMTDDECRCHVGSSCTARALSVAKDHMVVAPRRVSLRVAAAIHTESSGLNLQRHSGRNEVIQELRTLQHLTYFEER
jgi:hypothetical protein